MAVRQYVETNFTEIEQNLFDYAVGSFPESVLVQDGEESEDILALIATLAKVIGSSKELILNLKTAHSLDEIFQKIDNDYLADNNKKLLLPFVLDLKYHRLPQNIETDELLDRLVDEKYFVLDNYNLYKNRGTLTAITQLIKKWEAYLDQENLIYTLYELKDEVNIVIDGLEEFADFAGGNYTFNFNDETIETTFLRQDLIIFDMLMSIKPLGVNYNILLKYFAFAIENTINDRAIREGSLLNAEIRLSDATLSSLVVTQINAATNESNNNIEVFVTNPSSVSSLDAYIADWNDNSIFDQGKFNEIKEGWIIPDGSGVGHTQNTEEKFNYIFATTEELFEITADNDTNAIVTGYKWQEVTESDYNIANNKLSIIENVFTDEDLIKPTIYDAQNYAVPDYNLYNQNVGSTVLKYVKRKFGINNQLRTTYFKLIEITPGGFPGALNEEKYGYFKYQIAENFTYQKINLGPGQAKTFTYQSTDPNYNYQTSYLAVYVTRPNDTSIISVLSSGQL